VPAERTQAPLWGFPRGFRARGRSWRHPRSGRRRPCRGSARGGAPILRRAAEASRVEAQPRTPSRVPGLTEPSRKLMAVSVRPDASRMTQGAVGVSRSRAGGAHAGVRGWVGGRWRGRGRGWQREIETEKKRRGGDGDRKKGNKLGDSRTRNLQILDPACKPLRNSGDDRRPRLPLTGAVGCILVGAPVSPTQAKRGPQPLTV
jgi:hypothetical protein